MMIWSFLILFIFAGGTGYIAFRIYKVVKKGSGTLEFNLEQKKKELKEKKEYFDKLRKLALRYIPGEEINSKKGEIAALEEELKTQKGRLTITEAELESVETRLRELEEIERELEASTIDTGREVEMLRSQERDFEERGESLKEAFESSVFALDVIAGQLQDQKIVEDIKKVQDQIASIEKKTQEHRERILEVNQKYLDLKRAYDALDIEYAQLYEKQNALTAANNKD